MMSQPVADLSLEEIGALERLLMDRQAELKFYDLFPETGPLGWRHYPRHLAFFTGGAKHHERLFMAANRVGKSQAGGYEATAHLTGNYPQWWNGRTFDFPVDAWAVGKTTETTRDIVQQALCGKPESMGTGLIPKDDLLDWRFKPNTNQSLDWILVKHKKGESKCYFKSYDQGRKAFEGTEKHLIWLDEEPPMPIYTECLTRTATVNGLIYCTFTPLEGATEMVLSFLKPDVEKVQ